jgi:hypothetical protein
MFFRRPEDTAVVTKVPTDGRIGAPGQESD